MVASPGPFSQPNEIRIEETPTFKWNSISVNEIVDKEYRLEGARYASKARLVREELENCKWDVVQFGNKFIKDAYYLGRFKRIYVDKNRGIPFILPSQITDIYPKAVKFISPKTNIDIESTRVKRGQVLITRSGTIGNVSYVSKSLENQSLSDDVIRINIKEDYPGFIYAYFKSPIGRLLIETNVYGAVIKHIEPDHLNSIPIPNPPTKLKKEIHRLVEASFRTRDESNNLMDEAHALLKEAMELPDFEILKSEAKLFEKNARFQNYSVPLNQLKNRIDGSYHVPIVRVIEKYLKQNSQEVATLDDSRITKSIILPGRFKRVYVREENGVVFFGGKQLYHLDPANKKYLSSVHHAKRINEELKLYENMTLITCSGTIGKVTIVPAHWTDWAANQHIIRVVPANKDIAGYIYAWLSSDYANPLITRFTYGAVVDEIDDSHVSQIKIPLLQDINLQKKINDKVLESNQKRAEAYALERKALNILNDKVVHVRESILE